MRTKFATPILHAIDHLKNYDVHVYVFYIYITIDNIFFVHFFKFLVIFIFVVIILVQLCVILARNGMFNFFKSLNLVISSTM